MRRVMASVTIGIAAIVALVLWRGIPSDTPEMLFREPPELAAFHMSQIEVAARQVWRRDGRPPNQVHQLLDARPEVGSFLIDPWGQPYEIATVDTVFAVRSWGADTVGGTFDDLVQVSTLDTFWFLPTSRVPADWFPN